MNAGDRVPFFTAIRYGLEYAAVRIGLSLIDRLPLRACAALAAAAGDAAFLLDIRRRRTAVNNILGAGMASGKAGARRIARRSFRHLLLLLIEHLKAQRLLTPAALNDRLVWRIPAETRALLADPARGVIAAGGHFGNWEIAALACGTLKPLVAIAQPMKNPLVESLMARRTSASGYRTIPKHHEDMMRLVTTLKEGNVLGIMIDQYALKKPMVLDFLGRPACSHRGIALLHLVTRTPIVFISCRRTGLLQFECVMSKPMVFPPSGDKERDVRAILQALNGELETLIRKTPDQYMWMHRRWRPPKPGAVPQSGTR